VISKNFRMGGGERHPVNITKNKRVLDNLLAWARAELQEAESLLDREALREYIEELKEIMDEVE